ncbi:hypothetical protein P43SY_006133 [Pythium insidiosum]|uniref:Myosin-like protein n=1 Tax=Pythium insidiosum TaxID=114742 RepID=A0AAD5QA82_PYTIN|nr:hypothetical protein P43SY_006133 [Pythium insidiosum]
MLSIDENGGDMAAFRRRVEYAYIDSPRGGGGDSATSSSSGPNDRDHDHDRSPEDPPEDSPQARQRLHKSASVVLSRGHAEELFQKNFVGMLNKRGYNVRDFASRDSTGSIASLSGWGLGSLNNLNDSSETSTSSITSTTSSMSSVILGLREPNHGQGPLHIAVRKGDLQVLDALLDTECAEDIVNLQDNNGNTALHFAAGSWRRPQCAAIVSRLLATGADVRIKNKRGLTPIAVYMLTIKIDNAPIVARLLEHGSDPDTELDGEAMLFTALRRNLAAIVSALVAFGASLSSLNQDGLMCYEVATPRLRRIMIRSIRKAPPFLPPTQRSKCMRCSGALLSPKRVVSNFLKRILGMRITNHQSNCYHCGLLFCSQCLKPTQVADALPPGFARSRIDDLANVKTCPLCEAALKERQQKMHARQSLDEHNNMLFGLGA